MTRDTVKALFTRTQIERVELDIDTCENSYGVAPCTAAGSAGSECYNTFASCQDQANFAQGTQTIQFCHRGGIADHGEQVRPYVTRIDSSPTEIKRDGGLAIRGTVSISLIDEPALDMLDPYRATRSIVAGGTFWGRLLARSPNYAGRVARLRRGFATEPFSLDAVRDEQYIIDTIQGPDQNGRVTIKLSDRIKLLDRAKLPAPTSGKLITEVPAYSLVTFAVAGASGSIDFGPSASPIDDFYNGHEVAIISGTGAGQTKIITDYDGAARRATVGVAWEVDPNDTSVVEVSPLSCRIDTPAQYTATGYFRAGDEIIKYTGKSGDVLSWDSSDDRAQFGSERIDHAIEDAVQQCHAFIDATPLEVVQALINAGGIADANIDLAGIGDQLTTWATRGNVTACVASPETVSSLLGEICQDYNLDVWWDAVQAKVMGKCAMPELSTSITTITDDAILYRSANVTRQDNDRITEAGTNYAARSPILDRNAANTYITGELAIDTEAESALGFGDVRQVVRNSRFMTAPNAQLVKANTARKLNRLRNVPIKMAFRLDYRDEVSVGQMVMISTARLVGFDGYPRAVQCKITKVDDIGTAQAVEALSTGASNDDGTTKKYAFIAPAGYPAYATATTEQRAYAFVGAAADNTMSNGDAGYLIP